jgi:hypothetical protein
MFSGQHYPEKVDSAFGQRFTAETPDFGLQRLVFEYFLLFEHLEGRKKAESTFWR